MNKFKFEQTKISEFSLAGGMTLVNLIDELKQWFIYLNLGAPVKVMFALLNQSFQTRDFKFQLVIYLFVQKLWRQTGGHWWDLYGSAFVYLLIFLIGIIGSKIAGRFISVSKHESNVIMVGHRSFGS